MEPNFEELRKLDKEQADEYFRFIKASVADGSYFKDALNWYFFRYVLPICDRTLLIFGAIIAAIVLFFLTQMIRSAFPLVEHTPVFIEAKDESLYFPNIIALKPRKSSLAYDPNIENVDDAVLKYLLSSYIITREAYDFSKAEIEDVNQKFNRIRNTSSDDEYKNFQLIMSKDNPNSPVNDFGQDVQKIVKIQSVKIIKEEGEDFTQKAKLFLLSSKLPTDAEVKFSVTKRTRNPLDNTISEEKDFFLVKINFTFGGVSRDPKSNKQLNFVVNKYKLYMVK
jgi:type IV secretory pathway component VirB8